MPVRSLGGLFFRAADPDALAAWYAQHLGVGPGRSGDPEVPPPGFAWQAQGGPIVFAPFRESSDYFTADKRFMLNFRVDGLDALIAALDADGITVETRPEWNDPQSGRFARIHDPEGTPIELWEPPAE